EIDTFYATLPGDPAYEAGSMDAAASYRGIFTACLLNGLSGPDFSVCEMVDEDGQRVCVVSSRTLKPWLERQVPQWLATVSLTLNQNPDLRVESQRPKYLARLPSMPPEALRTRGPSRVPSPQPATDVLRGLAEDHGIGAYFASEIGV